MNSRRASASLWPALPATVSGRALPARFRRPAIRVADADRVLLDLVDWFEEAVGSRDAASITRERETLVRACLEVRARLSSRALDAMVVDQLEAAGVSVAGSEVTDRRPPAASRSSERPRGSRSAGLWPRLPATVLGTPIPRGFRRPSIRFADADRVLIDFVAWLNRARPAAAHEPDLTRRDREVLVRLCIDLRERMPGSSLDADLAGALRDVGVEPVEADAEVFDPASHRAAGRLLTTDPALHDHVAETERLGYADHGQPFMLPEVIVYRFDGDRQS